MFVRDDGSSAGGRGFALLGHRHAFHYQVVHHSVIFHECSVLCSLFPFIAGYVLRFHLALSFVDSDRLGELEATLIREIKTTDPQQSKQIAKRVLDSFQTSMPSDAKADLLKNETEIGCD